MWLELISSVFQGRAAWLLELVTAEAVNILMSRRSFGGGGGVKKKCYKVYWCRYTVTVS